MQKEKSEFTKGLKIQPETHRRLKTKASSVSRGINEYADDILRAAADAVGHGLALGTNRPTPAIHKTDSLNGTSGKYAPWVNRLITVLESKNEIVIEAIQKNLIAFCLVAGVSGEFAGGDAGPGNLPRQVANTIESAKRADADAQPVIEKHRRNRRDSGRREKGAA